jgi:hypothetical protein
MAQKKEHKKIKVRDLKPRKDAKGGVVLNMHNTNTHNTNTHNTNTHNTNRFI